MKNNTTIGITGLARNGKDTLANLIQELAKNNELNTNRLSFAGELKESLNPLVQENLNFSSFTEKNDEKELIRPLLVCFGTQIMRKVNQDHWISKLKSKICNKSINIITDVRFPNECKWIQDDLNGYVIHISRLGYLTPPNEDERINNPIVKKMSDFKLSWGDINKNNISDYTTKVKFIFNKIINENTVKVRLNFNQQHKKG